MTNETKRYICEVCNTPCSQVYGDNVDGRFMYRCVKCAFKKK